LDDRPVLVVLNATPVVRQNHRIGVPADGYWAEILNTDAEAFGGSGQGNSGGAMATPVTAHGRPFSLNLTLPPLAALFLRPS
jgi:1,4-alpha-glucan branching enzyme